MQLGPVMALVSGPTLGDAIADPEQRVDPAGRRRRATTRKLVDELFVRILNRPPTKAEVETCRKGMQADRRRPPPAGRGARPAARPSSPSSGPSSSASASAAIAAAKAALAAYEKELRPRARRAEAQEGRGDRQARGRPEGLRGHRPGQEAGRLGEGPRVGDRQPMGRARPQDHQRHQRDRCSTKRARRLDHRLGPEQERRRHDRRPRPS